MYTQAHVHTHTLVALISSHYFVPRRARAHSPTKRPLCFGGLWLSVTRPMQYELPVRSVRYPNRWAESGGHLSPYSAILSHWYHPICSQGGLKGQVVLLNFNTYTETPQSTGFQSNRKADCKILYPIEPMPDPCLAQ